MSKKINYKSLALLVLIPLAIGGLSALFTMGSMNDFEALVKPPISPPGWLFPVVWTVLYITMGVASYFVLEAHTLAERKREAFRVYFLQLGFNFMWSIIFFSFGAYEIAFAWLAVLFALIVVNTVRFFRIIPIGGILMIPYAAWVAFAGYLNFAIARLN